MKRSALFIPVFVLLAGCLIAQERSSMSVEDFRNDSLNKGHDAFIEMKIHQGSILQNTKTLTEFFAEGHTSLDFRVGWQGSGRQQWQRTWRYPTYGFGFFSGHMSDSLEAVVGTPSGIYGFIGMPWYRSPGGKFRFHTDLAIGASYGFIPYDLATNPSNDVIGSKVNVYFNLQAATYYQISDRIDLNFGAGLIHFSNGRWTTPNMGMNLIGFNVGMAYHLNPMGRYMKYANPAYNEPVRATFIEKQDQKAERRSEFNLIGAVGTNSNKPVKGLETVQGTKHGNRFYAATLTFDYAKRVWERGRLVGGLDVFYDGSLKETYGTVATNPDGTPQTNPDGSYVWNGTAPDDVALNQIMNVGAHFGHDFLMERFTLVTQFGVYLYKQSPKRGGWYLRAGGKIDLTDHLFLNVTLKTQNGGISDWVEFGMGYRIFKD